MNEMAVIQMIREPLSAYLSIPDAAPAMFHVTDRKGRILKVSDDWLARLGYARDEVIGRRNTDFLTQESAADIRSRLTTYARTGRLEDVEYAIRKRDGGIAILNINARALLAAGGRRAGNVAFLSEPAHASDVIEQLERKTYRLQSCLEGTAAGTWEWNVETGQLRCNERWMEIMGYTPDEFGPVTFNAWRSRVHPADLEHSTSVLRAHWRGDLDVFDVEIRLRHKHGHWVWVRNRGRVFTRSQDGRPEWMFGTHFSLEEDRKRDRHAQRMQRLLNRTGRAAGVGGWEIDLESGEVLWTDETRRIHGVPPDYVPTPETAFAFYAPEHRDTIRRAVDNGIANGLPWDIKLPLTRADGRCIHVRIIGEVEFGHGKPRSLFGAFHDITEQVEQQQAKAEQDAALRRAAVTDPLTGLRNRRGLDEFMAALKPANSGDRYALLHIDLDRFKPINDVFGHPAGDRVLVHVARILCSTIDTATDCVARVGGDEFVLILGRPATDQMACDIAQEIINRCSEPLDWRGRALRYGASVGIAMGAAGDLPFMLNDADIALYEAKATGRTRYQLFTAELQSSVEENKILSDALLEGIGRGEIVAHYQPQVCAATGRLVGFEALARWAHPERGLVAPADFLKIAEEVGLLSTIDGIVFEQALQTGRILCGRGIELDRVSVNVSLKRLTDRPTLEWLSAAEVLPFQLGLEILETLDVDRDFDKISWIFDAIRERGTAIEVDDFGSGHASLSSLLKIRPDRVKLDRQISQAASRDETGARAMVRAIAEMCRGIGIPLTAEGVETEEQAQLMRDIGCDTLQGYFFSRPIPRDALVDWALSNEQTTRCVEVPIS